MIMAVEEFTVQIRPSTMYLGQNSPILQVYTKLRRRRKFAKSIHKKVLLYAKIPFMLLRTLHFLERTGKV